MKLTPDKMKFGVGQQLTVTGPKHFPFTMRLQVSAATKKQRVLANAVTVLTAGAGSGLLLEHWHDCFGLSSTNGSVEVENVTVKQADFHTRLSNLEQRTRKGGR